jgi:hypothetical protein
MLMSFKKLSATKSLLVVPTPVKKEPVDVETPVTADIVVKSLLSTDMLVTNVPVLMLTPVTADAVVKSLLSTLIPVTNVPVEVETLATTVVVDAVTSVRAVPVETLTLWECPVYLTTLPGVAVENVTGSPGLMAPSATTLATPTTSTLTGEPAVTLARATPTTLGYVVEALYTFPSVWRLTSCHIDMASPAVKVL